MSRVIVTIHYGGGQARDLDLPADIPISQLAPSLAQALERTGDGQTAQELKYILKFRRSGQLIGPASTLESAGVLHGDALTFMAKAVPTSLLGSEAPRHFSGPGFVAASGPVFPLRKSNSVVGRADPASGVVESLLVVDLAGLDSADSPSVSRRHAQILYREGQYWLTDLRSTNGTRLNDALLRKESRELLRHGDVVRFGEVELTFIWDGQELDKDETA